MPGTNSGGEADATGAMVRLAAVRVAAIAVATIRLANRVCFMIRLSPFLGWLVEHRYPRYVAQDVELEV